MTLDSLLQKLFLVLCYLSQASSSNILNFLRRFFSVELSRQSRVSPELHDIMWSLNLYPELCWMWSLSLSGTTPRSQSTEDLTEFFMHDRILWTNVALYGEQKHNFFMWKVMLVHNSSFGDLDKKEKNQKTRHYWSNVHFNHQLFI